jgi:probable DNA metabolism protein
MAEPTDIVYLYDGSLPGLYCCVHESVYSRQLPCGIWPENEVQPSLYAQKLIETNQVKAARVRESIPKKLSPRALELVETVFLSCLAEKEIKTLRFLLLGYQRGRDAVEMLGHPDVAPMMEAEKHLGGEAHLLKGFVRFSDYGGVLAAAISPKNFILPFLAGHFVNRYPEERFIIYDKTNKAALIYEDGQHRIVPLEGIQFPEADETEQRYRAMWKRFYNTIAIEARYNPKCRMTHMPKRYWENMLEVADLL